MYCVHGLEVHKKEYRTSTRLFYGSDLMALLAQAEEEHGRKDGWLMVAWADAPVEPLNGKQFHLVFAIPAGSMTMIREYRKAYPSGPVVVAWDERLVQQKPRAAENVVLPSRVWLQRDITPDRPHQHIFY